MPRQESVPAVCQGFGTAPAMVGVFRFLLGPLYPALTCDLLGPVVPAQFMLQAVRQHTTLLLPACGCFPASSEGCAR
jgi:hypothetical protein